MTDIHAVASALRTRHYSNIARALRARQYDARSVRGRRGIRCIRVAVPDSNFWAWWGATMAWCGATTALATWGAVLYRGAGQIVQAGELLTTIPSTTTDVETIAEGIAIEIEIEAADREFLCLRWLASL
jgi:hypothetical protein